VHACLSSFQLFEGTIRQANLLIVVVESCRVDMKDGRQEPGVSDYDNSKSVQRFEFVKFQVRGQVVEVSLVA
jgi:hypothetical protein